MNDLGSESQRKGATLSDKTARDEYGLTQDEILDAIRAGALRCHRTSIYGNPCLRLFRREVEALVTNKYGSDHLRARQQKAELTRIDRELKRLKAAVVALEDRRSKLVGK